MIYLSLFINLAVVLGAFLLVHKQSVAQADERRELYTRIEQPGTVLPPQPAPDEGKLYLSEDEEDREFRIAAGLIEGE